MKTYVRTFVEEKLNDVNDIANNWAKRRNEEIVSANLAIRQFKTGEILHYLTVVFKEN